MPQSLIDFFWPASRKARDMRSACQAAGGRFIPGAGRRKPQCVVSKAVSDGARINADRIARGLKPYPVDAYGRICRTSTSWDSSSGGVWQTSINKRTGRCERRFERNPEDGGGE